MEESEEDVSMMSVSKGGASVASLKSNVGFFRDGKRRVDYILVYEKNDDELNSKSTTVVTRVSNRESFLRVLYETGLDLEEDFKVISPSKTLCFVKIYARWAILCKFAEYLNLRAPIAIRADSDENKSFFGRCLFKWFGEKVPNKPVLYYTCAFRMDKIKSFVGSENPQAFFTTTQRMRVVAEILKTIIYGNKDRFEVGIDRLVREHTFSAAFPPHDGPFKLTEADTADPRTWNKRQVLYIYWARYRKMFKYQPIEHIRQYFGEKIAIYFAWLGFYTTWLVPASIVGIMTFLIGLQSLSTPIIHEVCKNNTDIIMCPICEERSGCDFYKLSDTCAYVTVSYAFDHTFTVIYAIFVSTWAVAFIEFWKRESTRLAHRWNCLNFESEEEVPRPEFVAKAKETEINPVTGMLQPSFPKRTRQARIAVGVVLLIFMISLVIVFMLSVIIYKALINEPMAKTKMSSDNARLLSNFSGAILNLIAIMILGKIYTWLAFVLTSWEMHRTQTQFEDNFIIKVFLFQFVNFYSSIIYIAFFKGNFTGYPGHYNLLFGFRLSECMPGGCLVELTIQLGIIMIGKQVLNNLMEVAIPFLVTKWKKITLLKKFETIWEQDFQLYEHPGLFEEYLEMVIQFGFVTIFVAAFPLAPVFALINNLFEIRIDASKFLCVTRRTVPMRTESIGIWLKILQFLAYLAVIVNAFLIAFTSDFVPRQVYMYHHRWDLTGFVNYSLSFSPPGAYRKECRYRDMRDKNGALTNEYWVVLACRLAFVVVFEHLVFGAFYILKLSIPDIPADVSIKIKRELYLGKKALQDLDSAELLKRTTLDTSDTKKSRPAAAGLRRS